MNASQILLLNPTVYPSPKCMTLLFKDQTTLKLTHEEYERVFDGVTRLMVIQMARLN